MTWLLTLNDSIWYGPEPAEEPFRYCSALSCGSVVAPFCLASLLLMMPRAGFGRMNGRAGLAAFDVSVIVVSSVLATSTPSSRKDGVPFMSRTRVSENTTSSAVSGEPSANVAPASA